jgi:hypothetical protein
LTGLAAVAGLRVLLRGVVLAAMEPV